MPQLTHAIIDFSSVRDNEEHSKDDSKEPSCDTQKSNVNDDVLVIFYHGSEMDDTDNAKNVPRSNSSCLVGMLHISQDVTYASFSNSNKNYLADDKHKKYENKIGIENELNVPTDIEKKIEEEKENKRKCTTTNENILSIMKVVKSIVEKQFNLVSTNMHSSVLLGITILMPVEAVWGEQAEGFYLFVKVIFIFNECNKK